MNETQSSNNTKLVGCIILPKLHSENQSALGINDKFRQWLYVINYNHIINCKNASV